MTEEKFSTWVGGRLLHLKKDLSAYTNILVYTYLWVTVTLSLALSHRTYKPLSSNDSLQTAPNVSRQDSDNADKIMCRVQLITSTCNC